MRWAISIYASCRCLLHSQKVPTQYSFSAELWCTQGQLHMQRKACADVQTILIVYWWKHLCGTSLPTTIQKASQAKPRAPTNFSKAPGPALAAMVGRTSMPAAEPRYMPEVLRDTAFALSCGGIHCTSSTAGSALPSQHDMMDMCSWSDTFPCFVAEDKAAADTQLFGCGCYWASNSSLLSLLCNAPTSVLHTTYRYASTSADMLMCLCFDARMCRASSGCIAGLRVLAAPETAQYGRKG